MKIIAYTPQGTFESVDKEFNDEDYLDTRNLLSRIGDMSYFTFKTDTGDAYFPKEMLQQSVFVIEK
jgi:hypothetical protein